jgi:uncharacterized protein (DUF1919 family)
LREIRSYIRLLKIKYWGLKEYRYRNKFRKRLNNYDFTIISNNCWGGGIYETFGLTYNTPTVGLFFYAPCYIKFIENLKKNLQLELKFIGRSRYEMANKTRIGNPYPIGLLNDEIEIHFLHYASENEALEKWERRKRRVNYDNLFCSLTDNDMCTMEEIEFFDLLPYKKVFFSAKKIPHIKCLVWIKGFEEKGKVGDLYSNPWLYRKYFNVVQWLKK